jgi:hypothetical protein
MTSGASSSQTAATESPQTKSQSPKLRWHHLTILSIIVIAGAGVRFDGITHNGLWGDEFQALLLATGRGDAALNLPRGYII